VAENSEFGRYLFRFLRKLIIFPQVKKKGTGPDPKIEKVELLVSENLEEVSGLCPPSSMLLDNCLPVLPSNQRCSFLTASGEQGKKRRRGREGGRREEEAWTRG
jgi:hypothetical protein